MANEDGRKADDTSSGRSAFHTLVDSITSHEHVEALHIPALKNVMKK